MRLESKGNKKRKKMIRTMKEVAWRGGQNVMKELEESEGEKWEEKMSDKERNEKID